MRVQIGVVDSPAYKGKGIYLPVQELLYHVFIVGKTGAGKTVTLTNWMISLMRNLEEDPERAPGFTFLDPHGDAVQDVLSRVPPKIEDRVHVLHFRETDWPRGFNLLDAPLESLKEEAIGAFVQMLRDLFPGGTGPRMEHYLKNALLTLAKVPGQTVLSVLPLFGNDEFRERIVGSVRDPVLREFWANQFQGGPKALDVLGPILNKIGAFAAYPRVRRVVGQGKSTIDPLKIMNEGHILIIDLAGAGEDVKPLMGAALINRYHFSALAREGTPREQRRPHCLLADEIHVYATPAMADILSEDRKFGLGLVLATQYLERIPKAVLEGILGNIGTKVVLPVSLENATVLARDMAPFTALDLANLPLLHAAVKTRFQGRDMIFSMESPIPPRSDPSRAAEILYLSDQRDGRPVRDVDRAIEALFSELYQDVAAGKRLAGY